MNRKRFYIVVLVLLGCGFIYLSSLWPLFSDDVTNSNPVKGNSDTSMSGSVLNLASPIDTNSYVHCLTILNHHNTANSNWARDSYPSWKYYVDEGEYSLDEVTLAVEHFLNHNFADEFRIEYLRKSALTSKQNKELTRQFYELEPAAEQWGVSVQIPIPNPILKDFNNLTPAEQKTILAEHDVSVDDVAYFLLDEKATDNGILMLIAALKDPFANVSYDRYATTSLLEYAIMAHRAKIVEAMLNMGFAPTQDKYLGSSMEWALSALTYGYYNGERESAANIVLQLMSFGVPARFASQTYELVEGHFPRHFYEFNSEEIQSLIVDYNLDLTSIIQRETLNVDATHPLIKTLQKQQLASTQNQLNIPDLQNVSQECKARVTALNARWQPREKQHVVDEVALRFNGNKSAIIQALSEIEPSLVDYFLRQLNQDIDKAPLSHALLEKIDASYMFFKDGNAQQGIDLIMTEEVHASQYEFVMYKLLGFQKGYSTVIQSPFWVGLDDYNDLITWGLLNSNFIENMLLLGVSLYALDTYEKSLVYYAALKRNVELIDYLFDNNFQYTGSDLGQDPLHIALNVSKNNRSLESVENTVDALMRFQPNIDRFHKSRMKLIQLYYPDSYERIASRHPSLRINENEAIALPPTYF